MTKKPILFDARSAQLPRSTGWERYARGLANHLATENDVAVRESDYSSNVGFLWDGQIRLPKEVANHAIAHFPTFPPTTSSLRVAAKTQTKLIWTLHDLTWWKSPKQSSFLGRNYFQPLATQALREVHIVTPSEAIKIEVIERLGVPATAITAIPNGISEAFVRYTRQPLSEKPRGRPYFLYVGTIEPRKNLDRVIQAFEISGLASTHDFWLVGRKGWGSTPKGVIEKGVLTDQELIDAYARATATVLVSLDEGFGIPVIESIACSTPVVAAEIPALIELQRGLEISDTRSTAISLVAPTDVDKIATALAQVVANRPQITLEATQWAKGFSWQQSAERHLTLYRSLSEANRRKFDS